MSESAVLENHGPSDAHATPDEPFDKTDIKEFRSDDKEAGTNICKMLVIFFFYSLCAMSFVTWWAYTAMSENRAEPAAAETHSAH
ncbi:MAG: hypothetical protein JWM11_1126 [Planctomycetaceae bacterium]|nr:hypothetical protein [Planctomycetaceae bacterium]